MNEYKKIVEQLSVEEISRMYVQLEIKTSKKIAELENIIKIYKERLNIK